MRSFFFSIVLLCAVCMQGALAQQGECKPITTTIPGVYWQGFITPVKFGGGWTATVYGANLGAEVPGTVQFTWYLRPNEDGVTPATLTGESLNQRVIGGQGFWLIPNQKTSFSFVAPVPIYNEKGEVVGYQATPAPDSAPPQVGCIEIGFHADSLEALKGLPAPTVEMEYVPDGTVITVTRRLPHSGRLSGGAIRRAIEPAPGAGKTR